MTLLVRATNQAPFMPTPYYIYQTNYNFPSCPPLNLESKDK